MRKGPWSSAGQWAGVCWVAFLIATVSCARRDGDSQSPQGGDVAQRVVVYCSADKELAELVFHAYEAKTGVKILPLYDTEETKTAGITARLVAEKARPKADVFWSSDTSRSSPPPTSARSFRRPLRVAGFVTRKKPSKKR